jgi:hypothetical protein
VGVEVADHPAAAVEEDQRGARVVVGDVEACRPAGDGRRLDAGEGQRRAGDDARRAGDVRACLLRRAVLRRGARAALLEAQQQLRVEVERQAVTDDGRPGKAPLDAARERDRGPRGEELDALERAGGLRGLDGPAPYASGVSLRRTASSGG